MTLVLCGSYASVLVRLHRVLRHCLALSFSGPNSASIVAKISGVEESHGMLNSGRSDEVKKRRRRSFV